MPLERANISIDAIAAIAARGTKFIALQLVYYMRCIGVSIDATNDYAVQSPLMVAQGQCSELKNNIVRFISDMETREQAERRIITSVLSTAGHSNCASCTALEDAL